MIIIIIITFSESYLLSLEPHTHDSRVKETPANCLDLILVYPQEFEWLVVVAQTEQTTTNSAVNKE